MIDIDPKLSQLYREVSTQGPPSAIDALILAEARQQVASPKRRERPWWSRWMVPASLMATLVMGVSITLFVAKEHPEIVGGDTVYQSSAPLSATKSAPTAKPADSVPAEAVARKEAAAVATPVQAPQVSTISAPVQTPPASAEAKSEPSPAASPALAAQGRIIAPSAVDAVQAERSAKGSAFGVMREANVTSDTGGGAAASALPAPSAATVVPMRNQALPRSPEAWLEDIRRLIRESREKEADAQLAEFRKIYPTVAVPADIKP